MKKLQYKSDIIYDQENEPVLETCYEQQGRDPAYEQWSNSYTQETLKQRIAKESQELQNRENNSSTR